MEMQELLVKAGLPKDLQSNVRPVNDYPELRTLWEVMTSKSTNRVVFVYGNPCPRKDELCAALLRGLMEYRKKKGLWLTPTRIPSSQYWEKEPFPFPTVGVTAIVGVDLLTPVQMKMLVAHMRDQIAEDRCFILEVSCKEALDGMIGKVALNYLSSYALALEVHTKFEEPITFTEEI